MRRALSMAREFDVWVHSSNTIYKKVPFGVVTDWAQQGRLAGTDKLRPAGSDRDWLEIKDDPIISDFLFAKTKAAKVEQAQATGLDTHAADLAWEKLHEDDDDDVDMIPLIDISLVLLIFFMMSTAVSALSPVDVPQMKRASNLDADFNACTITIDKRPNGDASYSLRLGERMPLPGDGDLDTLKELLTRLDERVREATTPPDVRIACHRDLPSERVHDIIRELETRKRENKISS